MRQRIRFAAVLTAALIALTGAALAVAAHFDVLGAFFEGDTALAESLVDREARSVSDRNYTLTVESSVSGGTGAYLIVRVEAKTEAARAALLADDFLGIDTFSVNALREEDDALAYAGTQSFGMHEEARTDAAITWSVSESHADQAQKPNSGKGALRLQLHELHSHLATVFHHGAPEPASRFGRHDDDASPRATGKGPVHERRALELALAAAVA